MDEEWKPVVGYEGIYEVSSIGGVRRIKSAKGGGVGSLSPALCKTGAGYFIVALYDGSGKAGMKREYVHRLVAAAFIGPCGEGMEVNHKDGNSKNNAVSNLEYVTHARNVRHAAESGLMRRGERSWNALFNEEQVATILSLKGKIAYRTIAKMYGVSAGCITSIMLKKTWRHVNASA